MSKLLKSKKWLTALAAVACLAALVWLAAAAGISGAIFTTTKFGDTVNGNIYQNKQDVYLSGGPQPNAPCTSAGLPDGSYYFQVTDPSGKKLLSEDGVDCRTFYVHDGIITLVPAPGSTCDHDTSKNETKCGSLTIELMPYEDTPNNGGEYKVWATKVDDYRPDLAGAPFWGFVPAYSKTDNFKVRHGIHPPPGGLGYITGYKFYDANMNGTMDPGEPGIGCWLIEINPAPAAGESWECTGGGTGSFAFWVANKTTYTVSEREPLPTNYYATTPISQPAQAGDTVYFGNVCVGEGGGLTKGYWHNTNGQDEIKNGNTEEWLAALRGLCLVIEDGSAFDPNLPSDLIPWLVGSEGANAGENMSFQLSAQLAAMALNILSGHVPGDTWLYAPGVPGTSNGFITASDLVDGANAFLCANPIIPPGDPLREPGGAWIDALNEANNGHGYVQAAPCCFTPYEQCGCGDLYCP